MAEFIQLKADICAGTVAVGRTPGEVMKTDGQRNSEAEKRISHALRGASLNTWVVKPLAATVRMDEGSRNEVEVFKALPGF